MLLKMMLDIYISIEEMQSFFLESNDVLTTVWENLVAVSVLGEEI